jgi:TIR domain-containing protein
MKRIFVSWSGDRSRASALALKSLLEDVLGDGVEIFISAHMDPGVVWVQQIGKELEGSDFGVLCLTEDNFQSPWLLFEAGAIAKNFGVSRVVPYLIDDIGLSSPLNQFQLVRADHDGTLRLVEAINALRERPLPQDRVQRAFAKWWPDMDQTLQSFPGTGRPDKRSDRDLLESIWQGVQGLINTRTPLRGDVLALPQAETAHLLNLRDRPDSRYKVNDSVKKEFRMLRDLGLIRNRQPIALLPDSFKLNDQFDLTETGRRYADAISSAL